MKKAINLDYLKKLPAKTLNKDFQKDSKDKEISTELKNTLKDPVREKTLLVWEGDSRPFKKKNKKFYLDMLALLIVMGILLIVLGQGMILVVLFSLLFLQYALSTIPPEKITYSITNKGIYISETFYPWEQLSSFYNKKRLDSKIICINILNSKTILGVRYLLADTVENHSKALELLGKHITKIDGISNDIVSRFFKRIGLLDKDY